MKSTPVLPAQLLPPRRAFFVLGAAIQLALILPAAHATPNQLSFIGMQPCRVMDTRVLYGFGGQFGAPALASGESRDIQLWASPNCPGIPATVQAYALNITVVPAAALSFLTVWPAGTPLPPVSTLNAPEGGVVANGTIVTAGTNGAISIYATDSTDVIVDITGYYGTTTGVAGPQGPAGLPGLIGPQGLTGAMGATGATGPAGPSIAAVTWDSGTAYTNGALVNYNNSLYLALQDVTVGVTPGSDPAIGQWAGVALGSGNSPAGIPLSLADQVVYTSSVPSYFSPAANSPNYANTPQQGDLAIAPNTCTPSMTIYSYAQFPSAGTFTIYSVDMSNAASLSFSLVAPILACNVGSSINGVPQTCTATASGPVVAGTVMTLEASNASADGVFFSAFSCY